MIRRSWAGCHQESLGIQSAPPIGDREVSYSLNVGRCASPGRPRNWGASDRPDRNLNLRQVHQRRQQVDRLDGVRRDDRFQKMAGPRPDQRDLHDRLVEAADCPESVLAQRGPVIAVEYHDRVVPQVVTTQGVQHTADGRVQFGAQVVEAFPAITNLLGRQPEEVVEAADVAYLPLRSVIPQNRGSGTNGMWGTLMDSRQKNGFGARSARNFSAREAMISQIVCSGGRGLRPPTTSPLPGTRRKPQSSGSTPTGIPFPKGPRAAPGPGPGSQIPNWASRADRAFR